MFTDKRGKRVVFVAHCVLNQNAISDGTAEFPGANVRAVRMLLDAGVGIVQMPCPELCCLGLDRGNALGAGSPVVVENTRIRRELERPSARERLDALAGRVAYQAEQYLRHGFTLLGVVGVDRSPSCGVNTTSDDDRELAGQGLFVAALRRALAPIAPELPFVGVRSSPESLEELRALLETGAPREAGQG